MGSPAFRALPGSDVQAEFAENKAAMAAALARWEELVDLVDMTAVPGPFVDKLPYEFRPGSIGEGLGKAMVLHHVLNSQILGMDDLVFVYQPKALPVLKIRSLIRYFLMLSGHPGFRLESVL